MTALGLNPFAKCAPFTRARNRHIRVVTARMVAALMVFFYVAGKVGAYPALAGFIGYLVLVEARALGRDTRALSLHRSRFRCGCGDHR